MGESDAQLVEALQLPEVGLSQVRMGLWARMRTVAVGEVRV